MVVSAKRTSQSVVRLLSFAPPTDIPVPLLMTEGDFSLT